MLVRKEVRFYLLPFAVTFLYALGWVAMRLSRTDMHIAGQSFEALSQLYGLFIAVLVGAVSSEERALGTAEWQILQPYAFWKQWLVKATTVTVLALMLGLAVPILLEAVFPLIRDSGSWVRFLSYGFSRGPLALRGPLAIVSIALVSFYVSTLCGRTPRADPGVAVFVQPRVALRRCAIRRVACGASVAERPLRHLGVVSVLVARACNGKRRRFQDGRSRLPVDRLHHARGLRRADTDVCLPQLPIGRARDGRRAEASPLAVRLRRPCSRNPSRGTRVSAVVAPNPLTLESGERRADQRLRAPVGSPQRTRPSQHCPSVRPADRPHTAKREIGWSESSAASSVLAFKLA